MKNKSSRLYLLLAALLVLLAPAFWGCNSETDYARSLREQQEKQQVIDNDTILNYLKRNNMTNYQRTNSGVYLVTLTAGTGTAVTAGKQVSTKYIGRFLSGGPVNSIFDNSSENHSRCGCAVFTAGSGTVAGFTEGLLQMRTGDRKLLLIPSQLGYGSGQLNATGSAYIIPPNAVLAFDIEVLGVSQ